MAYKRRLRTPANVRYVFAFAMNDKPGRLNYHLVFAGQHPKGLEKMKEAMMRIDQTGTYSFADHTVGPELFRFNFKDPATSASVKGPIRYVAWLQQQWSQVSAWPK